MGLIDRWLQSGLSLLSALVLILVASVVGYLALGLNERIIAKVPWSVAILLLAGYTSYRFLAHWSSGRKVAVARYWPTPMVAAASLLLVPICGLLFLAPLLAKFRLSELPLFGDALLSPVSAVVASLAAPLYFAFTEEIVFRGYLLRSLLARHGIPVAVTLSSMAFVLAHTLAGDVGANLPALVVLSLGCCAVAVVGRSIWWAVLLHAGTNLANTVAILISRHHA